MQFTTTDVMYITVPTGSHGRRNPCVDNVGSGGHAFSRENREHHKQPPMPGSGSYFQYRARTYNTTHKTRCASSTLAKPLVTGNCPPGFRARLGFASFYVIPFFFFCFLFRPLATFRSGPATAPISAASSSLALRERQSFAAATTCSLRDGVASRSWRGSEYGERITCLPSK